MAPTNTGSIENHPDEEDEEDERDEVDSKELEGEDITNFSE